MAAGLAHAHRAVAAAVEQKNALLPPVHGFLQRLGHAGADLPGIAGGQLGAHINKIHRGQRAAAVTVLQRDQPQTAADRRLISLGAGGGGGKEQQGVFHGGAFLGHIMGGIARRGFALIGVLLLLIQNNQAEILQRRKDGAAGAHHDIRVALLNHPPLQEPLGIAQRRVLHRKAAAEHGF